MMQSAGIVVNDVTVTGVTGTQHCAMHPSQYGRIYCRSGWGKRFRKIDVV